MAGATRPKTAAPSAAAQPHKENAPRPQSSRGRPASSAPSKAADSPAQEVAAAEAKENYHKRPPVIATELFSSLCLLSLDLFILKFHSFIIREQYP
jgi:hypothetical protein